MLEDLSPVCSACGKPATTIKLLHEGGAVRLVFEGICGGNGEGQVVSHEEAAKLRAAFAPPRATDRRRLVSRGSLQEPRSALVAR